MQTMIPAWPTNIERKFRPIARLLHQPTRRELREAFELEDARRTAERENAIQCSGTRGTWTELMYANYSDFAALASSATEASLLAAGPKSQPVIPALFWDYNNPPARTIGLLGRGVFSNTGTPTGILTIRLGTTSGPTFITGTVVAVSPTITTASGITNVFFEFRLELACYTPGIGTGNTTLSGAGYIKSPAGFASPFDYALEPTTPPTGTWTATIDNSVTQYVNVDWTWSASSASNTITLKSLYMWGYN